MGLPERVSARVARTTRPRAQALSLDEYASWFSFGGQQYPVLQTTYSALNQERIAQTADWAAKTHSPVSSLVSLRQRIFSQIRFQWTRMSGAQPGDLFGSKELQPLERPWPGGTTSNLLAWMEWDASAGGNAFVRRKGPAMHRLFPSWVIIVLGSQEDAENPAYAADTTVAGYLWVPPGGQPRWFEPQQICHYWPHPDPYMHFLGMSWITWAMREVQADQAALEHRWQFFEHGGSPNFAIRFDPAVSLDAVRDFKELMETEHGGALRAWKTLFLGGGAQPVPIGSNFRDMDYAVIQAGTETRLAAAAGVHPSIAGFSAGLQGSSLNAGNYDAARRLLGETTMPHLWGNVAASFEPVIDAPRDARGRPIGGASLWYDSRIPFMRADTKDQAAVQAQEAQTIAALIREGYEPDAVITAVRNNDWSVLTGHHSGLTSVQLVPPASGQEPLPGFGTAPAVPASNGNGARP